MGCKMRKVILFMMVSVDGFFEGPNHDLSWHNVDDEMNDFIHEQNSTISTILFGHRTYEMMAEFWLSEEALSTDKETAIFMTDTEKVVFSHRYFNPEWKNTTVITDKIADKIKKLKESPGKHIAIFGSNNLCVNLIKLGLIDEFRIVVNPVVLGEGTALFKGIDSKLDLKLVGSRSFKSGNVLVNYITRGVHK